MNTSGAFSATCWDGTVKIDDHTMQLPRVLPSQAHIGVQGPPEWGCVKGLTGL